MPYLFAMPIGTTPLTMMEKIFSGMTDTFDLVGEILTQIAGQPLLLFCLASSLIPIGITIFRQLRHATV